MAEGKRAPEDEPDPQHRTVRIWARAVNQRDPDTMIVHSTPDVDVYPMQIGVSGHYQGPDGLRRWIDEIIASDLGHRVDFRGIRTLPDGRVALFGEVFVGDASISSYTLIATLRDGKVAATRSYLSDEETLTQLKLLG